MGLVVKGTVFVSLRSRIQILHHVIVNCKGPNESCVRLATCLITVIYQRRKIRSVKLTYNTYSFCANRADFTVSG